MQLEMIDDLSYRRLSLGSDHHQHPLLGFGQHDLVGAHPLLPPADPVEIDVDAATAAVGQLAGGTRQSGGAQVLNGRDAVELVELQAGFAEQLLKERVPNLDRGAPRCRSFIHLHGGEGRAMDPVTARVGTDHEHDVAGAISLRAAKPALRHQPDAHRVDNRVVGVAAIEVHLTTDRWTAETIAVATDAGDDALEQVTISAFLQWTETQGIEDCDGTCPHGKNIPKDPPHPGSGPLVGLDRRRMVVRLDLEDERQSIPDTDGTPVLAGSVREMRPVGAHLAQQR